MSKNMKIALIVGAVIVAGIVGYIWYRNRQANEGESPTTGGGTNLNSPAPNMQAASVGAPTVGPAVTTPINITISHAANELPEGEANPFTKMKGDEGEGDDDDVEGGIGPGAIRPASKIKPRKTLPPAKYNPGLLDRSAVLDLQQGKSPASPYQTEY